MILGSFSVNNFKNKEIFYHKFKEYTDSIKEKDDVLIAAQWLPSKAWYFGGSALLNLFVNEEDINWLLKLKWWDFSRERLHDIVSKGAFNDFELFKKILKS